MKRVIILGSTGSIGKNTLRVISERRGEFSVVGLAGLDEVRELTAQAKSYSAQAVALAQIPKGRSTRELKKLGKHFFTGADAATRLVAKTEADICLVAISGAAALEPTLAAIEKGMDIALASKEVLVMAGEITTAAVRAAGVKMIPVDSEHSALFQCLAGVSSDEVENLWLTASGGPFLGWPVTRLKKVTPQQALAHPSWQMGPKITIDSATMMNKGLEVIEAHHLFGLPAEKIKVVAHPQSLVHSMVELVDGSLLAQLSEPDMRLPIQYALTYPERRRRKSPRLDFSRVRQLEFLPITVKDIPCLELAYRALVAGGTAPAVMNAANEEAVPAFLAKKLDFLGIQKIVKDTMRELGASPVNGLGDIKRADAAARKKARALIKARKK